MSTKTKIKPKFDSAMLAKIMIYGFLIMIIALFFKLDGLPEAKDKIKYLAFYIPALIATMMMFTAGVNFSLGVIIQKSWLIFLSVAQYLYLFFFEYLMKTEAGFTQIEYYKRAIYYIPIFATQLFLDRFLHKNGSIEGWFFKAKIIAGLLLIGACTWNYMAFDTYFSLVEPKK